MAKNKKTVEPKQKEVIRVQPFEVREEEVNGDQEKLVKKFIKKTKKYEVLSEYFDKCLYFKSDAERDREKYRKKKHKQKNATKN